MFEQLTSDYTFFTQYNLVTNGHFNGEGSCLGLATDWLNYITKHPGSHYIDDKYNSIVQCKEVLDVTLDFEHLDFVHSKNFYNRINYYQAYGNSKLDDYNGVEIDKCQNLPDKGIIALMSSNDEDFSGHATAYSIDKDGNSYVFKYFDSNFGEFKSHNYDQLEQAKSDLITFINNFKDYYSKYTENSYDEIYVVEDTDRYLSDMKQSWKIEKSSIENMGVYEYSPTYEQIEDYIYA